MQTLTNQDLQFVVRHIPKDVREQLMTLPLYAAGGFIRETIAGGEVKDIDLFGETKEALAAFAETLAAKRQVLTHRTDNAITLLSPPRMPVQYITRWVFSTAQPLVESFDFTVCQVAIWFDRDICVWRSMCSAGFYPDLAARRLVYTFPVCDEEAGGSMMRVLKFLSRGYNIQATSLAGVMARVAMKVRMDDLHGKDEQSMAIAMAGLLHEVDPMLVVDGLEPIDEHQVV
jgi:hypothetical protein